jgi:hypothetical protein
MIICGNGLKCRSAKFQFHFLFDMISDLICDLRLVNFGHVNHTKPPELTAYELLP